MQNFIETAAKAQNELNEEKAKIDQFEERVKQSEIKVNQRNEELDKKQTELTLLKESLDNLKESLTEWESKKKKEEDVQKMFDDANGKLLAVENKHKEIVNVQNDVTLKLQELAKRELALSEAREKYKEEVKQEMMSMFLGGNFYKKL